MNQYERSRPGHSFDDPLLKMEMRAFTSYMPTSKNSAGIWAIGTLLAIIVCRLAFADRYTPEQIYLLGAVLLWIAAFTITFTRILMLPQNAFREWWLTLPVPRETLVHARMLGSLPLTGCFAAALWLVATVHSVLTSAITDSPLYADGDRIIGAALAYAALYAAITILITFIAMLVMIAMQGWRQWLLPLFFSIWCIPTVGLGVLYITHPDSPWLAAGRVWLYSAGAFLLIPLVRRLCLNLIPKYGFDWIIAKRSLLGGHALRASFLSSRTKAQRPNARGFKSLYALERSVFRNISAIRWVRMVYGILVLGTTAGGFITLEDDNWVQLIRALIVIPGIFTVTMLTLRFNLDINKRRLEWVLTFPYSRLTVMLSRLLAAWATSGIWLGGLAGGMALGAAARYLFVRPEHFGSHTAVLCGVYMIAMYFVYIISSSLASTLTYGYGNRQWLAYVSIPILMLAYMGPMLFNQFIMPESLIQSGISESRWVGLALYAVIGLPLSWGAFVLGSKGIATTLYMIQARQRKQGIKTFE
ncbi:hypothetical protein [Paenibacillus kobensis]|uniref:hypothetical protein n=1 Tax=Paenibacillus kobensis TaxID=59841 RepID=UPI000FDB5290|nr:hypothetical protein [Paenibacillus kobensis]